MLIAGHHPGERIQAGTDEHVICAVLNTLDVYVSIPTSFLNEIVDATEVVTPLWPLGVYIGFTVEGAAVGVFGRTKEGALMNAISNVVFEEEAPSLGGSDIWQLWKALRNTPPELMQSNLGKISQETFDLINGPN